MKRLLLAAVILAAGGWVSAHFHKAAGRRHIEASVGREQCRVETRRLEDSQRRLSELTRRVREMKRTHLYRGQPAPSDDLAALVVTNARPQLSPEQRERLLDELGFTWNSTDAYIVVSKDSLRQFSLSSATRGNRLTESICAILAITADERGALEDLMEGLAAEYAVWAAAHFQRSEPQLEELVHYSLPGDAEASRLRLNACTSGVNSTIGLERGALFLHFAFSWMDALQMREPAGATLIVSRPRSGEDWIPFKLKSSNGGVMSTVISPYQPFPEPFQTLVPGGWRELAKREGFDLGKKFGDTVDSH